MTQKTGTTPQDMIYNHVLKQVMASKYTERVATDCACRAVESYKKGKFRSVKTGWINKIIQHHIGEAKRFGKKVA